MSDVVATVAGTSVSTAEVDRRETELRASVLASALPRPGTSEGRQLRRWLTQLLVTERVVAREAAERGVDDVGAPTEDDLLPDTPARLEIGSVAAYVLREPLARNLFEHVTAHVEVSEDAVAAYHVRNPHRFVEPVTVAGGWHRPAPPPSLDAVRTVIAAHLLASARRRAFRLWLDARRADLVDLAPGYEHPGDPRQPDNTHRH
ncbi:DUF7158 domain-containing protein [Mycolicibacterium sediminis]|uniref:Malonyl CoA-ACP transacylase n=1 Tax=Mycolicibacterium sediminis TaxID=1286180 RepID=A0A7I7QQX8_9MYCO|nr:malonyl CoA-ACP transacylase [Mycolicibacterium sediminis]BBY28236.1 malonyl CoA-ACP transacylase [Mycolicibacterium sediminis]